ncbi:Biogenesis of lysosome-related organelles complex 1 subunit 5 [Microtus ochrogaster]|uniref:Biogenesis of lysosome-related organelles complex 1 subunit 5 n=1 Tax=Microtus ochrogaster TaxID=79684 RepID=A0A8J6GNY4_MICOH|nr:Biogenesis of lysosome-related organelles complex 1 subunit 5 [Microtus ochrogaster]
MRSYQSKEPDQESQSSLKPPQLAGTKPEYYTTQVWKAPEKRGLRELRVLENLKNIIEETNERMLPKCRETMQDGLEETLQKLQAANDSICRLQQREQEREKVIHDHLTASEKQRLLQWEEFLKEQPQRRAEVDDEHRRAMERLREQYAAMEKDLAKFSTF